MSTSLLSARDREVAAEVMSQFDNIDESAVLSAMEARARECDGPFRAYDAACHICGCLSVGIEPWS